jgi:hypothetical protein
MNNNDYCRAVLLGVVIGIGFITGLYVFTMNDEPQTQPVTPKSSFEVIDTYKGCDVVRWTQPNLAEYKYFLHCQK